MSLANLIRGKSAPDKFATATPATFATQEGERARTVASVATVAVATTRKPIPEAIPAPPAKVSPGNTATASRWWHLHFADREPLEVCLDPSATHAEVLALFPDAVAAEPIQPAPAPAPACVTCLHRPPRHRADETAPCGNPVAAGLSDLPGVIRYSPDQGASCPAWQAALDPDQERRIRAMAARWQYTDEELALALDGARSDPDGWRRVVAFDETWRH